MNLYTHFENSVHVQNTHWFSIISSIQRKRKYSVHVSCWLDFTLVQVSQQVHAALGASLFLAVIHHW